MAKVLAVSGFKNSGKTTLIEKLITVFIKEGLKVATIKHDGHDFAGDCEGTDTYRHMQAGAMGTAIFSNNKYRIINQVTIDEKELFSAFEYADIILLEGFKYSDYPKIEIVKQGEEPVGKNVVALVSEVEREGYIHRDHVEEIMEAIQKGFGLNMKQTTAIVLVGGRSRRMNFQDKMDLKIGDDSFLEKILKELSLFSDVIISANQNQIEKLSMNQSLHIVEDKFHDIGPLGGIYSVMEEVDSEYYFVVSCDMPFVTEKLIEKLYNCLETNDQVVVAESEGRVQPLFAIYHRSMKSLIEEQIRKKDFRMMNLLEKVNTKYVELEASNELRNINTQEELENINGKI
ncbi:MAG: molybdopterin-guanine dinucleotide biosynthesis protein B [Eubacteriales bacterium]